MDLVYSSFIGNNSIVFPEILKLYVPHKSIIGDVTFGKGVFWKNVDIKKYSFFPTDLKNGVDFRNLPYENSFLDCLVLDPPYMHSPGGTAHNNHQKFEEYYKNNSTPNSTDKKYHEAVLELYIQGMLECKRVLKENGIFIVKCQDEVCANRNRFTHVEIINEFQNNGFICEDLFVVTQTKKLSISRMKVQKHARKNHSYFLVFRKKTNKGKLK